MFDWWIHNMDRTEGNTNLLWDDKDCRLMVIDHNSAFDKDFSARTFREHHVFKGEWAAVFEDLAEQARHANRLEAALSVWDEACHNVPPEWRWANDERDVVSDFNPAKAFETLARCSTPDFWRMV